MCKVDEAGLFFRCLLNRSYVVAREQRSARGSNAMRAKERVTAVLCVNADGSHRLPIAIIGTAARSMYFRPLADPCSLPYFSQANAWMDAPTMTAWFQTVFIKEVRRVTSELVYLVMDNASSHGLLGADGVTMNFLSPYTTPLYQPLDMGYISAVKRRYKLSLLRRVLNELNAQLAADRAAGGATPAVGSMRGLAAMAVVVAGQQPPSCDLGQNPSRDRFMLKAEWEAVNESIIAKCWLKADILLPEAAATIHSRHGVYHPGLLKVDEEVGGIVELMQSWTASGQLTTPEERAEHVISVSEWLATEELPATVLETVENMGGNEGNEIDSGTRSSLSARAQSMLTVLFCLLGSPPPRIRVFFIIVCFSAVAGPDPSTAAFLVSQVHSPRVLHSLQEHLEAYAGRMDGLSLYGNLFAAFTLYVIHRLHSAKERRRDISRTGTACFSLSHPLLQRTRERTSRPLTPTVVEPEPSREKNKPIAQPGGSVMESVRYCHT